VMTGRSPGGVAPADVSLAGHAAGAGTH